LKHSQWYELGESFEQFYQNMRILAYFAVLRNDDADDDYYYLFYFIF